MMRMGGHSSKAYDYESIGVQFHDTDPGLLAGNLEGPGDDPLELSVPAMPTKPSALRELVARADLSTIWSYVVDIQPSPTAAPLSDAVPSLNGCDETLSIDGVQSLRSQPTHGVKPATTGLSPCPEAAIGHRDKASSSAASPSGPFVRPLLSTHPSGSLNDAVSIPAEGPLVVPGGHPHPMSSFPADKDLKSVGFSIISTFETQPFKKNAESVDGEVPSDGSGSDADGGGQAVGNEKSPSSSSGGPPKRTNGDTPNHGIKRQKRVGREGGPTESLHSKNPGVGQPKVERHLACPFYKRDPNRHRGCYGHILTNPSRVKQHLFRAHKAAQYCSRCLKTFPDEGSLHQHLRADVPCRRKEGDPPSGLTAEQVNRLRSRVGKHYNSDEEHWYWIFGVLFPDASRPDSPYIDHEVGEDVTSFIEFGRSHGASIFLQDLEQASASTQRLDLEMAGISFGNALRKLFEKWKAYRTETLEENAPAQELEAPRSATWRGQIDLDDPPRRTDTTSTVDRGMLTDISEVMAAVESPEWHPSPGKGTATADMTNTIDVQVSSRPKERKPLPSSSRPHRSPKVVIADEFEDEVIHEQHKEDLMFYG